MLKPKTKIGLRANGGLFLGVAAVLLVFIASGIVSYSNIRTLRLHSDLIAQTHETLTALGNIVSAAKDAETG